MNEHCRRRDYYVKIVENLFFIPQWSNKTFPDIPLLKKMIELIDPELTWFPFIRFVYGLQFGIERSESVSILIHTWN